VISKTTRTISRCLRNKISKQKLSKCWRMKRKLSMRRLLLKKKRSRLRRLSNLWLMLTKSWELSKPTSQSNQKRKRRRGLSKIPWSQWVVYTSSLKVKVLMDNNWLWKLINKINTHLRKLVFIPLIYKTSWVICQPKKTKIFIKQLSNGFGIPKH
jgi:hypothetical protein